MAGRARELLAALEQELQRAVEQERAATMARLRLEGAAGGLRQLLADAEQGTQAEGGENAGNR